MILVKTEAGHQALKDRTVRLTPRQRSAFILFDGKRSVSEVLASGMGIGAAGHRPDGAAGTVWARSAAPTPPPIRPRCSLRARHRWRRPLRFPRLSWPQPAAPAPVNAADARPSQQRYQEAYPIATRLTASLGLRGFRLNLQVEGAGTYEDLLALAPKIRAAVGRGHGGRTGPRPRGLSAPAPAHSPKPAKAGYNAGFPLPHRA